MDQPGKDRLAAAALALLLGGFGIHKFYLGRTVLGILYLLFCWTGIPRLIAWVEAITYLARSNEAWAAEYGGQPKRPNAAGLGCLWFLAIWPAVGIAAIVGLIFLGGQVSSILPRTGSALPTAAPLVVPTATVMPSASATLGPTVTVGPSPSPTSSALDQARVVALMARIGANPKDAAALMSLGDVYYEAQMDTEAAAFYGKVLALEPKNVMALLAHGAADFNLGDLANARRDWLRVVALDPQNVEAHYDLGYAYLNRPSPDYAGVQREWNKVLALDPRSEIATLVRSHLAELAAASLLP